MSYTETFTAIALAPAFITGLAVWIAVMIVQPIKEDLAEQRKRAQA